MKTVYLISGLGTDERVFSRLQLSGIKTVFLPWIEPYKGEGIREYARRMSEGIKVKEGIIIVGLSFGGLVAKEMAQIVHPDKVILISSVKNPGEFPPWFTMVKSLKLNKLIHPSMLKVSTWLMDFFFGPETKEQHRLLVRLIRDTDNRLVDWSIRELLHWKNLETTKNLYHLHGTRDRIFPAKYLANVTFLEGATHFMIISRAKEVSDWLQSVIGV